MIDYNIVAVIGIVALLFLMICHVPIGFSMAIVGFVGYGFLNSWDAALSMIAQVTYATTSNWILTVIPLFILMGEFVYTSGLSTDGYYFIYKFIGHLPGGLAMATNGACTAFAAVTGSSLATSAAIGKVALPEMKKYQYEPSLATGCVAAGGTLGTMIPPSIPFVVYGMITDVSIGKLFIAGILPGLLVSFLFMLTIYVMCLYNPSLGPRGPKANLLEKVKAVKGIWGIAVLFLLIIGGIYTGVFTPTEAAAIGAFGSLLFVMGKRKFTWKMLVDTIFGTGKTVAMIFMIMIGAFIFSYFLTLTGFAERLAEWATTSGYNRYVILAGIVVLYLFFGSVMDMFGIIVITVPIFITLIIKLGWDPIWFGVIAGLTGEMGMITPPVGLNVFVVKGIAPDVELYTIFRGILPFILPLILSIIFITIFPEIATWLPTTMR